ncbi:MAG: hypothetical protein ABI361_06030 [Nitrososphaera sp.]|jgi:hypothetical protein
MAGGLWIIIVIPAVLAFLFALWVTASMVNDVSHRDESGFTIIGPDGVRQQVVPG